MSFCQAFQIKRPTFLLSPSDFFYKFFSLIFALQLFFSFFFIFFSISFFYVSRAKTHLSRLEFVKRILLKQQKNFYRLQLTLTPLAYFFGHVSFNFYIYFFHVSLHQHWISFSIFILTLPMYHHKFTINGLIMTKSTRWKWNKKKFLISPFPDTYPGGGEWRKMTSYQK